ncbi:MAG: hypothetical protein Q9183_005193, partial [Haloplaca sp. 2 TL-2023]
QASKSLEDGEEHNDDEGKDEDSVWDDDAVLRPLGSSTLERLSQEDLQSKESEGNP